MGIARNNPALNNFNNLKYLFIHFKIGGSRLI